MNTETAIRPKPRRRWLQLMGASLAMLLAAVLLAGPQNELAPPEIEALIRINLPWLEQHTGCCSACAGRFRRALSYFRLAGMADGSTSPILPTAA